MYAAYVYRGMRYVCVRRLCACYFAWTVLWKCVGYGVAKTTKLPSAAAAMAKKINGPQTYGYKLGMRVLSFYIWTLFGPNALSRLAINLNKSLSADKDLNMWKEDLLSSFWNGSQHFECPSLCICKSQWWNFSFLVNSSPINNATRITYRNGFYWLNFHFKLEVPRLEKIHLKQTNSFILFFSPFLACSLITCTVKKVEVSWGVCILLLYSRWGKKSCKIFVIFFNFNFLVFHWSECFQWITCIIFKIKVAYRPTQLINFARHLGNFYFCMAE